MFAPRPQPNQVLVYRDFCEECLREEYLAHFPDGTVKHDHMKHNPAFYYAGHKSGVYQYNLKLPCTTDELTRYEQLAEEHEAAEMARFDAIEQDW